MKNVEKTAKPAPNNPKRLGQTRVAGDELLFETCQHTHFYYSGNFFHRRKIHMKKSTQIKSSSEHVVLSNFRWVPDFHHREEAKSSFELFEKVRVNAEYFGISGLGWVFGPLKSASQLHRTSFLAGVLLRNWAPS